MRYLIWGTGPYCRGKLQYWDKEKEIIAFVERTKIVFCGQETILPDDIMQYQFDYIAVMSSHYLEIIPEIVSLGVEPRKIIPGICFRPLEYNELERMVSSSEVEVNSDGSLTYKIDDERFVLCKEEDWKPVREYLCREGNVECIQNLGTYPAGRVFGHNRGGSIGRYYIDRFLSSNRTDIKGNVLEIGDRGYTEKYGTDIKGSYVLHYSGEGLEEPYDFCGDLQSGEGIKKSFYDCIILTQVLDFIFDIQAVVRVVRESLNVGGVCLVTVSGITPISRSDMDRYGHFWNFTTKSLKELFEIDGLETEVMFNGNCKVACACLQGMAVEDLTKEELDWLDEDFQVTITARIVRVW